MSKAIDNLSKNLATGVSRRKALWRLLTSIGAIGGLGLFLAKRKALAEDCDDDESPLEIMFSCFSCRSNAYEACLQEPYERETGCEEGDTVCLENFCHSQANCFYEVCLQDCGNCPDFDSEVCDADVASGG